MSHNPLLLCFPLWNFDTEMPEVTALVYPNSPHDLTHAFQLWVFNIRPYILHYTHTVSSTCSKCSHTNMYIRLIQSKRYASKVHRWTQRLGRRPDLLHHSPAVLLPKQLWWNFNRSIHCKANSVTLPRPQRTDNTVYSVLSCPVKIGQVTAQSELCQHMCKTTARHTPLTIHAHTFTCTQQHVLILHLYVWHKCRQK